MKEAGKSSKILEEICPTESLDRSAYDEAREKAAKILLQEKSEISEKKSASLGKKKKKDFRKQKWFSFNSFFSEIKFK